MVLKRTTTIDGELQCDGVPKNVLICSFKLLSYILAFHRTEGDFDSDIDTLWESVVFEGVTYAMGFYLAFAILGPLHPKEDKKYCYRE